MDATLTLADDRPGFERLWARLVSFVAMPGDDDEALRKKRLLLVVVLAKAPACPSLAIAYLHPRRAARGARAGRLPGC